MRFDLLIRSDHELRNLDYCDTRLFEIVATQNRDVVLGVKVRMGQSTVGPSHIEPIKRAREAADRCQLPLMGHIATPPPELAEFLGVLERGDIATHCSRARGCGSWRPRPRRRAARRGRRA